MRVVLRLPPANDMKKLNDMMRLVFLLIEAFSSLQLSKSVLLSIIAFLVLSLSLSPSPSLLLFSLSPLFPFLFAFFLCFHPLISLPSIAIVYFLSRRAYGFLQTINKNEAMRKKLKAAEGEKTVHEVQQELAQKKKQDRIAAEVR